MPGSAGGGGGGGAATGAGAGALAGGLTTGAATSAGAPAELRTAVVGFGWGEPLKRTMPRAAPAPTEPIRPAATISLSMGLRLAAGVSGSGEKSTEPYGRFSAANGSPSGLDAQAQAEVASSPRGAKAV